MRAEIRTIEPSKYDYSWEAFEHSQRVRPVLDDFDTFVLRIGPQGEQGTDLFLALVATPAAASRARRDRYFEGFIVDSFEPKTIQKTLRDFVASVESETWQGIVDQLRGRLKWEYDGIEPVK